MNPASARAQPNGMPTPPAAPAPSLDHGQRFERLFRAYAPYVQRVMPRMGVAHADLDDATQEVFLAVHRGLAGFEQRSSERTWIYGICIRVCSNYRRRAHRRREQLDAAPPEPQDPKHPERALLAQAALARLDRALRALPEAQRAVFVLHEVEQLDVKEIAEALDCSKFTVYARLKTAHRRVRAYMADDDHDDERGREVSHA